MKKIVLLYSGGLDSTVLLELALSLNYQLYCILFDYGQSHVIEIVKAEDYCKSKNIPYQICKIKMPVNSGLTGDNITGKYTNVSPWYVPARNLIFVANAVSIVENLGLIFDEVWVGANYEDRVNQFPDCSQEWVYQLNKVLAINGSKPIKLVAPLLGMSKDLVTALAEQYKINNSKIYSGYDRQ